MSQAAPSARSSGGNLQLKLLVLGRPWAHPTFLVSLEFPSHMSKTLQIPSQGSLDFVSLGGLVHRLDPGIIPFRKATECHIHVSGGEFNVAANLADCFGLRPAIASAMSDYPIGDL